MAAKIVGSFFGGSLCFKFCKILYGIINQVVTFYILGFIIKTWKKIKYPLPNDFYFGLKTLLCFYCVLLYCLEQICIKGNIKKKNYSYYSFQQLFLIVSCILENKFVPNNTIKHTKKK